MKKALFTFDQIFIILITFIVTTAFWIFMFNIAGLDSKYYATSAEVVNVSLPNDTVTVKDFSGNLWQFKECEDWAEHDICAMIMDSKNTPEIKDDIIASYPTYCGYLK